MNTMLTSRNFTECTVMNVTCSSAFLSESWAEESEISLKDDYNAEPPTCSVAFWFILYSQQLFFQILSLPDVFGYYVV